MATKYNRKVKKPGTVTHYTKDQAIELIKCRNDVSYMAKHYIKIIHVTQGVIKFEPYDYQEEMLDMFKNNDRSITLTARQMGKSTVSCAYLLHYGMFNPHQNIWVLADKLQTAKSLIGDIRLMYENLPSWLKPGVVTYNKTHIEFENGSTITCGATTPEAVTGESISLLFLDEFAKIPPTIAFDFWNSCYPTLGADSKLIIVSTPKGIGNKFHQIYKDAEKKNNDFGSIKVKWDRHPDRDEKWKEKTLKELKSKVAFAQEFDCDFLGSSITLVCSDALKALEFIEPDRVDDENYSVFETYNKKYTYIFSVDVAEGTKNDYSIIQIFRLTNGKLIQVAKWSNNEVRTRDFSAKIYMLTAEWGQPWIIIENNTMGKDVVESLWYDYEYENLYVDEYSKEIGVKSTKKTKAKATTILKRYIEEDIVVINDELTITELCTFIEKKPGIYQADGNCHDDLVVSLYWGCYLHDSEWFKDTVGIDRLERNENSDNDHDEDGFSVISNNGTSMDALEQQLKDWMKNN